MPSTGYGEYVCVCLCFVSSLSRAFRNFKYVDTSSCLWLLLFVCDQFSYNITLIIRALIRWNLYVNSSFILCIITLSNKEHCHRTEPNRQQCQSIRKCVCVCKWANERGQGVCLVYSGCLLTLFRLECQSNVIIGAQKLSFTVYLSLSLSCRKHKHSTQWLMQTRNIFITI